MKAINVKRSKITLQPDRARVLIRPFRVTTVERAVKICARVLVLPETEVKSLLAEVLAEFDDRHHKIRDFLKRRFEHARPWLPTDQKLTEEQELLIGAYFSHEYSFEAAALFNPSIVPHPDQSDLPPGSLRFVMSLRATGEGHISSVTFRTGLVDAQGGIKINEPTRYSLEPAQAPNASYDRHLFERKLAELSLVGDFSRQAMEGLGERFTLTELQNGLTRAEKQFKAGDTETLATSAKILLLAQSNYDVQFEPDSRLSERVLFPVTPSQSNGIEDARFVAFRNDDGTTTYYATYTACRAGG